MTLRSVFEALEDSTEPPAGGLEFAVRPFEDQHGYSPSGGPELRDRIRTLISFSVMTRPIDR